MFSGCVDVISKSKQLVIMEFRPKESVGANILNEEKKQANYINKEPKWQNKKNGYFQLPVNVPDVKQSIPRLTQHGARSSIAAAGGLSAGITIT